MLKDDLYDYGADFSDCRKYRYTLWRFWDKNLPKIMFLGLNPSTADEVNNDPTVTRCINYSKLWGYGGMYMMNIFAYRTTYPVELKKAKFPIGENNDFWIIKISNKVDRCIGSWGNDGTFINRYKTICKIIPELYCLKINNSGQPSHPLYLKSDITPFLFRKIL